MKTELLIIKNNGGYIRVKDKEYSCCCIDKASVFTMDRISIVKNHVKLLREKGFDKIFITKLILTEVPFNEDKL